MAKAFCTKVVAITMGAACCLASAEDLPPLTLQQAHETALRNHPLISVADLKTLAARQVTRQVQSGFFPNLSANVVAVGTAENNTRLAAIAALNNPRIFDRNAEGLVLSQLITDFGRTANLTGSARLRAEAAANNAQATREQILLAVDGTFYSALQAQSITRVAEQTVTARQVFLDQVSALASNKLRSDLDVSFARVNVEDAKLLLSKAQNDLQAAFAQLSTLMGLREPKSYRLAEQPLPLEVSTNVSDFVQQALRSRPDLLGLRNQREAALKFARGEKALRYPTISAVGSAGVVPIHDPQLPDNYAAAGVRSVNEANLILPAGDVKVGPYDYNIYANNQINAMKDIDMVPLKTVGEASVLVADVGEAKDAAQIQYNKVRINGQPSVYIPVLKQGGDANTIDVVDGVKKVLKHLLDVPSQLVRQVDFDQSVFVRTAIDTLLHEGAIGLVLTGAMILLFLGSMRATAAVFLSIPLSALATFIAGVVMMVGIVVSNSILIVEFTNRLRAEGRPLRQAVALACRVRLRPVLMTSLATLIGLLPMAAKLGAGSEAYAPLARSIIGGLAVSVVLTVFIVPCAYYLIYRRNEEKANEVGPTPALQSPS